MTTDTLVEEYATIFPDIELLVRSKIGEEVEELFKDNYYTYISENNFNGFAIKKSLEGLLKKARRNYTDAKKLFHNGRLSEEELYEYKDRIREITDEISNLNL